MRHKIEASPKEKYEGGCIYFDTDSGHLIIDGYDSITTLSKNQAKELAEILIKYGSSE